MKKYFVLLAALLVFGTGFSGVHAHTTVEVGPYEIEVGWQDEPPVVGILNAITVDIREPNEETGAYKNITNGMLVQPNQNPIAAINFASPSPIPSLFLTFL